MVVTENELMRMVPDVDDGYLDFCTEMRDEGCQMIVVVDERDFRTNTIGILDPSIILSVDTDEDAANFIVDPKDEYYRRPTAKAA